MKITKSDLTYKYPDELVATQPQKPPRVLFKEPEKMPREINFTEVHQTFQEGDLLVVNQTEVLPRRIFLKDFDVLFLESQDQMTWKVLFPAKKFKVGDEIELPEGLKVQLIKKGRPQLVKASEKITDDYFKRNAFFALPPYIQQARGQMRPMDEDALWYQTQWAAEPGSLAAPTASLHFSNQDLEDLKVKSKIKVTKVTLHVGLGTFMPLSSENLEDHEMHSESVFISKETITEISECLERGHRVWALGTTSLRAIEAYARGHLQESKGQYFGQTDLFLKPGDDFLICGGLLTNFHQPGSTLISLVSAFAGHQETMQTYKWAVEKNFRLFSYGDLSIWCKL